MFFNDNYLEDLTNNFKSTTEGFWLIFQNEDSKKYQLELIENVRNNVLSILKEMEDHINFE